jgi:hypothetical protein
VPEFVRSLNSFVNLRTTGRGEVRIVNEAEFDPKERVSWHHSVRRNADGRLAGFDADHDPDAVLVNVGKQTGLTFKAEKRKVRVLAVAAK